MAGEKFGAERGAFVGRVHFGDNGRPAHGRKRAGKRDCAPSPIGLQPEVTLLNCTSTDSGFIAAFRHCNGPRRPPTPAMPQTLKGHIQHTRAIKYSYLYAVVPPSSAAALLSPAARFTGVKPNIYECNRTKCGSIDLVRAHLSRYRTHIQHTRAIKYSYLSAVVPPCSAAALLSPAARFTGVDPNTYEHKRTKCGNIDLVRAHLCRYRTHIQHTRAIEYSYLSAVVPPSSAAPLRYLPRPLLLVSSPIFMNIIEPNAAA